MTLSSTSSSFRPAIMSSILSSLNAALTSENRIKRLLPNPRLPLKKSQCCHNIENKYLRENLVTYCTPFLRISIATTMASMTVTNLSKNSNIVL